MKVYNILIVKKAVAMSVHYIIQYTICNLAIKAQFHQFKSLCKLVLQCGVMKTSILIKD